MLLLIFIIGFWELIAFKNWVDPFIISSPSRIIKQLIALYENGSLFLHITTTLTETIYAFVLSTIIGLVIAIILYSIKALHKILEPYLVVLNSLPKIALGPLIIIWVGVGTKAIVTMGILICVIITIINLLNGAEFIPTLLQICYAISIGYLFVTILRVCDSLWPCIITHSIVNSLSIFNNNDSFVSAYIAPVFLIIIPILYTIYLRKKLEISKGENV